ncbi:MAG TPA: polysaccharide deacetylase family protein [Streptosporangiaceae bacterium]|nr:polysaccharide deacetylase family protein [Streptosporangiaceae bacterium]
MSTYRDPRRAEPHAGRPEAGWERRAVLTRRLVLSVGGITLLAGCIAESGKLASTAQAKPVRISKSGHPGGGSAKHKTNSLADPDKPVFYVEDGSRAIALTIDDGPDAIYTPQVLQLLAKYRVTAMFSMIGTEVSALPAVARDVADAGHEIANHTWRHLDLGTLAPSAVTSEMDQATDAIHTATGIVPSRFRAPYGVWSSTVLRHCAQTGMTPIDWSVDPRDWARPGVSAIVSNIMSNTRGGSIILEHDGGGNRSETVAALKIVIPRLLNAGYHFVTP